MPSEMKSQRYKKDSVSEEKILPEVSIPAESFTSVKKIREALSVNLVTEFVEFIKKYGVIGLAIGVVVGQSVNSLVQSIVNNLINPLIGLVIPRVGQLTELTLGNIRYGQFLNDLINFILILFVVFVSIKFFINRLLSDGEREKLNLK